MINQENHIFGERGILVSGNPVYVSLSVQYYVSAKKIAYRWIGFIGVIHTKLSIWVNLEVGRGGDIRGAERIIRKSKPKGKNTYWFKKNL